VYCPRCGTPNEPGDRFCSSCGAQLEQAEDPAAPAEGRPAGKRASALFGTTRRARLVSAATVIAVAVAVAAFIALDPAEDDEGTIPRDAYTVTADGICLVAKRQIIATERRSLSRGAETSEVAAALLPIVATWRSEFQALDTPSDRTEQASELDSALRGVELGIGQLARIAARGDQGQTLASAKRADEAATRVEEAITPLGLSQCSRLTIGLTPD
jgi:hypothetical protein